MSSIDILRSRFAAEGITPGIATLFPEIVYGCYRTPQQVACSSDSCFSFQRTKIDLREKGTERPTNDGARKCVNMASIVRNQAGGRQWEIVTRQRLRSF